MLYYDRRAVGEDLRDSWGYFRRIIFKSDNGVGTYVGRVFEHEVEGMLSSLLAELGINRDITAKKRLYPRADIPYYRP